MPLSWTYDHKGALANHNTKLIAACNSVSSGVGTLDLFVFETYTLFLFVFTDSGTTIMVETGNNGAMEQQQQPMGHVGGSSYMVFTLALLRDPRASTTLRFSEGLYTSLHDRIYYIMALRLVNPFPHKAWELQNGQTKMGATSVW